MPQRYAVPGLAGRTRSLVTLVNHEGKRWQFVLGKSDPKEAVSRARWIYQTVVEQGWEYAFKKFAREVVIGFEWSADPLMWTYTTINTIVSRKIKMSKMASNAETQRVLVVEEDAGVLRALEWCINQHQNCVGVVCRSAEKFWELLECNKPCLVLLNRMLAGRLGVKTLGSIGPHENGVQVLTYYVKADGDELFVSTPGGATGYMIKRVKPECVLEPILRSNVRSDLQGEDLALLVREYFEGMLSPRPSHEIMEALGITQREHEVMSLICRGYVTDRKIAKALKISVWTAHEHVKNIFRKLQVRSRAEAVTRYLAT
jgi:DNA-binding NarL/FixJ family response regulator